MGRITGQIAGRVALILLAGLVVTGASYALSLTPASSALTSLVGRGGGGPPPGAIPAGTGTTSGSAVAPGGTAPAGGRAGRGAPPSGAAASGTGTAASGTAAAGQGAARQAGGGGRPADPSRGVPEFAKDLAALAGIVLVAVLLGKAFTLLAAQTRRRRQPAAP